MTERYHLVGVGGTGMSALAQVLLASGCRVSGSDRSFDRQSPAGDGNRTDIAVLRAAGADLFPQDGSGVTAGTAAVAVSSAIESDNPDLAAAARLGIPVRHRAELLAERASGHTLVGVAGSSGKSTVTAMIGWILEGAGFDPVVVNGAVALSWASDRWLGNVRWGAGSVWVAELDESDRSLLKFVPDWAVVTNVSRDHFGLDETRQLFQAFEGRVRGGVVRGEGEGGTPAGFDPQFEGACARFNFRGELVRLGVPGRHNADNALLAALLCERLGVSAATIRDRLETFAGLRRRFETVSRAGGVTVVDDYAHNPAKIAAALDTAKRVGTRVLSVWRPHGYGPLAAMKDELAKSFADHSGPDDRLWLLPVFDAGGTADRRIRSEDLVQNLAGRGVSAELAPDTDSLVRRIVGVARAGDVVLVMGARDPDLPALARAIGQRIGAA